MGFASVKFNDCFVVENLKIVQGGKGTLSCFIGKFSFGELLI